MSGSSAEQHVLRRQIRKWRQGGQGWDERLETALLIGGWRALAARADKVRPYLIGQAQRGRDYYEAAVRSCIHLLIETQVLAGKFHAVLLPLTVIIFAAQPWRRTDDLPSHDRPDRNPNAPEAPSFPRPPSLLSATLAWCKVALSVRTRVRPFQARTTGSRPPVFISAPLDLRLDFLSDIQPAATQNRLAPPGKIRPNRPTSFSLRSSILFSSG